MIVVLGLALLFFGGLFLLIRKDRHSETPRVDDIPRASQDAKRPMKKAKAR